ncbi:helix-turn-helix domain-containing protein [Halomicrococcus sp. NG-SE-24]|uniref:helix-turn-helix domain-containing protein n=1 Tax=Halomicrococcus sp. NG-SE-24 TaxID=3436928 RepID=UPI003D99359B
MAKVSVERSPTRADVRVPAETFALAETFDEEPEATFEMARVAANGSDRPMPFLRMLRGESLTELLGKDSSVDDATVLSDCGQCDLLYVTWSDDVCSVLDTLLGRDASMLAATGRDAEWEFELFFPTRAAMSSAYDDWEAAGLSVTVETIHGRANALGAAQGGLTDDQYETLRAAVDRNYYDVPRGATTEELAEELGVSHQAISERLRRGHENVVQEAVDDDRAEGRE